MTTSPIAGGVDDVDRLLVGNFTQSVYGYVYVTGGRACILLAPAVVYTCHLDVAAVSFSIFNTSPTADSFLACRKGVFFESLPARDFQELPPCAVGRLIKHDTIHLTA